MKAQKLKTLLFNSLAFTPLLVAASLLLAVAFTTPDSRTLEVCGTGTTCSTAPIKLAAQCGDNGPGGSESEAVQTSIDFGCYGNSCANGGTSGYCSTPHNGIIDLLFAIIRFLTDGVGLVIVASVIVGGIQYIVSRGDPNATGKAIKRLVSAVTALFIFVFAYAILNFVIPGGFFK